MPLQEKRIKKIYYSIGEVAVMFDVNKSLIRFWEKEFNIIKPKKNKKGNRYFTEKDINNFKIIFHLVKERGYTLDGAKKKLRENKEGTIKNVEIVKESGHEHVVESGHTLSVIAQAYGTTVDAIKKSNDLKSDVIYVGQKLFIPE